MRLIKFIERIIIKGNPEQIFDYTQDYDRRLEWDTFLIRAELIEGKTSADNGVKAYCVAKNGLGMETTYVSFQKPNVAAIKMTKGPLMFRSFFASWRFKQLNQNETEVFFLYSFSLRFPFSIIGYFIKNNLTKNVKKRLSDLKQQFESS